MEATKRDVDVVIISDVHLGTYGCHATELLQYLKSINPKKLILNGDIIDMWQFSKRYWPTSHMLVIKHLSGLIANGTEVTYVTGNHDEVLRKFEGFELGTFKIVNKVVLKLGDKKAWIFHGDVFDVTMQHSRWLAKLGAIGYDLLILINRFVNFVSQKMGRGRISLSKQIKDGVKSAVSFINDFESTAINIAIDNGYEYVVCGHIHKPAFREETNESGSTTYLNSGDWVENLTSLEYHNNKWTLYQYEDDAFIRTLNRPTNDIAELHSSVLFENLVEEFSLLAS